ncbi:hypothetical protein [Leisingera caerulea]|uniref:hypothetical protein n=1 Tax=Leisingera caerulea TaxID=506591 RepID=UPI00047F2C60|nr:hypothetical protein [Leisingera caerulea]
MTYLAPLANPDNRCDDCTLYRGDWCCTINCSNAELKAFQPFGEAETVELRVCEDGKARWHVATRDGWQVTGAGDGATLMMKASHYAVGTKLSLREPITSADQA